jgi:hypothetical protein
VWGVETVVALVDRGILVDSNLAGMIDMKIEGMIGELTIAVDMSSNLEEMV